MAFCQRASGFPRRGHRIISCDGSQRCSGRTCPVFRRCRQDLSAFSGMQGWIAYEQHMDIHSANEFLGGGFIPSFRTLVFSVSMAGHSAQGEPSPRQPNVSLHGRGFEWLRIARDQRGRVERVEQVGRRGAGRFGLEAIHDRSMKEVFWR